MRRLPPLKALRGFEATARLGSVSGAAEELCISHSAVSQQIRILEEFFGEKLFERDGRGVQVTVKARRYLEDVQNCLDRLGLASEKFADRKIRRSLRVNLSASFAHSWLIPRLPGFAALHPDIDVELTTPHDLKMDMLNAEYDIIIRRQEPGLGRPGYQVKKLIDMVAVPIASPALPELAQYQEPQDLQLARLLHFSGIPDGWNYWFQLAGLQPLETLGGRFFDEFLLLMQSAIYGFGVGIAPLATIREELKQNRLVYLFPEVRLVGPAFFCLHRDVPHDEDLNNFLHWLLATAEPDRLPEDQQHSAYKRHMRQRAIVAKGM